ncbi:uncharacterized protein LOC144442077 [Glandiceps talaboti]
MAAHPQDKSIEQSRHPVEQLKNVRKFITEDVIPIMDASIDIFWDLDGKYKEKSSELTDLKDRTASMIQKNFTEDRETVENVNDKYRPSVIEGKFKEFIDNERMDAVDRLQNLECINDLQCYRLPCRIFEIAFEMATTAADGLRSHLSAAFENPTSAETSKNESKTDAKVQHNLSIEPLHERTRQKLLDDKEFKTQHRELLDHVNSFLMTTAEKSDLSAIVKKTCEHVNHEIVRNYRKWSERKSRQNNDVGKQIYDAVQKQKFIEKCTRLCWLMSVQTPPMIINYPEQAEYDARKFTPHDHFDKQLVDQGKTPMIKMCVWPALMSSMRGTVLRKGIVSLEK